MIERAIMRRFQPVSKHCPTFETRMKVLVTGAAGFIGMHTSERLLARGDEVVGLDNLNDYYDPTLKEHRLERLRAYPNFRFVKLDVADRDNIERLFKLEKFDRVVHLAAQAGVRYSLQNPHAYVDSNLVGFINILEGCRHNKVQHLVYASSSSVYGGNTKMPFSEHDSVDHPVSLYAATKKANELMAHSYSHLYGLPTTGLRFFTVYGPLGRPDMALFLFVKAIAEGRPIDVFNEGNMERDFTYIDDIVEGVLRTLDHIATPDPQFDAANPDPARSSAPYRVFNIGAHTPVKLMDFIEAIELEFGKKAIKNFLPMQAGDVPATYADVSELTHWTDFNPGISVRQGVGRFLAWYRAYYEVCPMTNDARIFGPRAQQACYFLLMLAYIGGAGAPLIDQDSAHHAAIALRIHDTGDWATLLDHGQPYLDKPHLLFWLGALSFQFFGVSTVSFKLFSLLFSLLAVHSTVRLAAILYNETAARLAGVILASAFAFILANNDARMDAILVGAIIYSTWQLVVFVTDPHETGRGQHMVMGTVGLACGFAAKGPIGIVIPLLAVFLFQLYRRNWKRLFDPLWLPLPVLLLLFISPVLYAYYHQFGTAGLDFILFDQTSQHISGGRYAPTTKQDLFVLFRAFLWVFLPWSLLSIAAMTTSVRRLIDDRFWPRSAGDALTAGTIVVVFFVFAVARLKSAHYLNILLPFLAIQLGAWLPPRLRLKRSRFRMWRAQVAIIAILGVAALIINGWWFRLDSLSLGLVFLGIGIAGFWLAPRVTHGARLVIFSVTAAAMFWFLANYNAYPQLMRYQAGTVLGHAIQQRGTNRDTIFYLEGAGHAPSFDILTQRLTPTLTLTQLTQTLSNPETPSLVVYATAKGRELLNEDDALQVRVFAHSPDYLVSRPDWKFLNPATRKNEIGVAYLLGVSLRPQSP